MEESIPSTFCVWDFSDGGLVIAYAILLLYCCYLIVAHRSSWLSGQALGLIWYLSFTALLCGFRLVIFIDILFNRELCDTRYKAWQWDVGDADNIVLTVLSTASAGLFFTSYSYFANSLAKVLEMLINDDERITFVSERQFLVAQIILNSMIWASMFWLWYCSYREEPRRFFASDLAEVVVSFASVITCIFFCQHVARAWWFMKVSPFEPGGKASQLYRLMGLRRVLGVARVVTVCFCLRALVMLSRVSLSAWMEDAYFFFTEILPTGYLLHAFRSSDDEANNSDVTLLKDSITSSSCSSGRRPITVGPASHFPLGKSQSSRSSGSSQSNSDRQKVKSLFAPPVCSSDSRVRDYGSKAGLGQHTNSKTKSNSYHNTSGDTNTAAIIRSEFSMHSTDSEDEDDALETSRLVDYYRFEVDQRMTV